MTLDIARDEFRTAVKAVTYHQFDSHQNSDWKIQVFVDVDNYRWFIPKT
ncbi:MAG: hypothetical protein DMG13_19585 [Acidobacteria bacterium]|nr:MAG: hypothetical protein DMG13_19585 [Acidobacteriota bacterium]